MKLSRFSFTALISALVLFLAACSQPASRPAEPADSAVHAQAVKNITINNTATCEAAGGQMDTDERECFLPDNFTLAAGDTLNLGGSAELGSVIFPDNFTNYGTILSTISIFPNSTLTNLGVISLTGGGDRLYHDTFINSGTLNLTNAKIIPFVNTTITNTASGIINLNAGGTIQNYATFINDGTINVYCGGSFSNLNVFNTASYTGNPTLDGCAPSVTLNQASTQADPTGASTIHFTAVFSERVFGFTAGDVTLKGTAGATTVVVSEIAPNNGTTYDIAVSGMTQNGTVIASIDVAKTKDAAGNDNTASTSTDHTVTYVVADTTAPTASPSLSGTAGAGGWYRSDVTVTWNWTDNSGGSGIDPANCTTSSISSGEGGAVVMSATCKDNAGNTGSGSQTLRIDKTAPTITFASRLPAANANSWNNADVTVTWNCTDATSGPVLSTVSRIISTQGSSQSASQTCTDNAGNTASNTQTGINIDKTPPTLSPSVSPNPVLRNLSATATPNAADALSGLASSSCPAVPTSSTGAQSVTCTATDRAGNTTTAPASYTVLSSSQALSNLRSQVQSLPGLGFVNRTLLLATLSQAQVFLSNGVRSGAVSSLNTFIGQVDGIRGISGGLTNAQANALIAQANLIIQSINAGG